MTPYIPMLRLTLNTHWNPPVSFLFYTSELFSIWSRGFLGSFSEEAPNKKLSFYDLLINDSVIILGWEDEMLSNDSISSLLVFNWEDETFSFYMILSILISRALAVDIELAQISIFLIIWYSEPNSSLILNSYALCYQRFN